MIAADGNCANPQKFRFEPWVNVRKAPKLLLKAMSSSLTRKVSDHQHWGLDGLLTFPAEANIEQR